MDPELRAYWRTPPADSLSVLFDHAPVLALSLDAQGTVRRASRRWAALLGIEPAAAEGRPLAGFLAPGSGAALHDRILPALLSRGACVDVPLDALRHDRTAVPVLLSATAELDGDGGFVRALAFLTDVSGTRDALEALERKASEAEEASMAKSRFLAAMSHEIRTPMNAILGFAQLLSLSDLDEARQAQVASILSAGNALMTLLRDLLDLSQVEAGFMRIERRPFDLRALVDEVAQFWRGAAEDRGLQFGVATDPGLPDTVVSDPLRIRQVLNNYLGNAVKFTPSGRVDLHVGLAPEGAGSGERPVIRFRVSDTGPGIHPQDVARLFAPFVQASGAGMDRTAGWGLGLSICSNIAAAMDARLDVETAPGAGASFLFDLPVSRAPAASAPARPRRSLLPPPPPLPHPLKILLAEDNVLNQDVMRGLLRDLGHEVETVANGFEAVEAVADRRFDVLIMDVMMPGLDGAAATRRIRSAGGPGAQTPIVGCSAHVSAGERVRYARMGMSAFLAKPVNRADLAAVLAEVVAGAAAADGLGS